MSWFLKHTSPVAVKTHTCEWCGCSIIPGEKYQYEVQVVDGDFMTIKSHPLCRQLLSDFWDEGDFCSDEGIDPEGFREMVDEEYREICQDKPVITTFGMRLEWVKENRGMYDALRTSTYGQDSGEARA